uniref:Saccharopine dehydrogenase NADP binding domain-containing protein n=1 Tax=Thermosporothrix sp. COM3 TaxID=2490863 RepID=A0A455SW38_9CHLR|nr:hypothetical protein KTC_65470 [Thermosporothrix sp. COM3]
MKLLLLGFGNFGTQFFDVLLLSSRYWFPSFHVMVAGRRLEYIQQRTQLAICAAHQLGLSPEVSYAMLDLWNEEQIATLLWSFQPDVIFTTATMLPSSAITRLPSPLAERLKTAGAGPWLPWSLVLQYKLMRAVQQTGLHPLVLIGASPDNAPAVLAKGGLTPTTGVGNAGNLVPALRRAAAAQLHLSAEQLEIYFVGHNHVVHRLRTLGTPGDAPYHLSVRVDAQDVTPRLNQAALFQQIPSMVREYTQILSASSAVAVLENLWKKQGHLFHAPGANGLPGAYPLRATANGVEVVLPPGLSLQEAIRLNVEGQKRDGIERIEQDGTIWFSADRMQPLTEVLGYQCRRLPLTELEGRAQELYQRFCQVTEKDGKSAEGAKE